MKTGKLFFLCMLILAACSRENPIPGPLQVNLTIADYPTKASVKSAWESGDVIYVFFKGVALPKYLEMKYNGVKWEGTAINGLSASDLSVAPDKRMTAFFPPYGNSVTINNDGTFSASYSGFFLQSELETYTYDGTLSGTLNMVSPTLANGEKLIHFDVSGYTASNNYNLYQESLRPIVCTGISSSDCILLWSEGSAGDAISGHAAGSVLSFSGALSSDAVGTAIEYQFSVDDATSNTLFTRSVVTKTISTSIAIGLGSLTDGAKWNANAYVDLSYTNAAGKRVLWATKNLGAYNPSDIGLYFAFGETSGYSAYSGHDFSSDPAYEAHNDILNPAFDAAHVAWKGLWRMPTANEIDRLRENTVYSFEAGVGGTFTHGTTSVFFPASGYIQGTSLVSAGTYGACWSSSVYDFDNEQAYLLGFSAANTYTHNDYISKGQTIRPVFSIE